MKQTNPPKWALTILKRECDKPIELVWVPRRSSWDVQGRWWPGERKIMCASSPNKTKGSVSLLLHEIAHVLTGTIKTPGMRTMWHGKEFHKQMIRLYEKYGLLEFTSKWEGYARNRKAIVKYLKDKRG